MIKSIVEPYTLAAIALLALSPDPARAQVTASAITVGSTPVYGTCPSSYNLYNNNGIVGCQANGSGGSTLTVGSTPTSGGGAGQIMYDSGSVLQESAALTYSGGVLSLGTTGSVVGGVSFANATSGSITVAPATGALGTVTATLPANSGTIAELNLAQTWTAGQTFTNGDLLLKGSSSGALTLEAPAAASAYIATLPTNTGTLAELNLGQSWTGNQNYAAGTCPGTPLLTVGNTTTGFCSVSTTGLEMTVNGANVLDYGVSTATYLTIPGSSITNGGAFFDGGYVAVRTGLVNPTYLSSNASASGVLLVGSSLGGVAGSVETAVFISASTKPTLTTGSCSGSSAAGGATAGTFTAAVCAAGTYTLSGMPAAPAGYSCDAQDRTTLADTLQQTASSTTSATFAATTAASDVVQFKCIAF